MRLHLLGRTGLRVSELCLGAMTFGEARGDWGASPEESRSLFDTFVDAGGNFVDTANGYQLGQSETLLGEFLQGQRDQFVVATKYSLGARESTDANASGNHRKSMMQGIEGSLRRLKTDHIDLYWMHAWDGLTSDEEVMRGLDDLVRSGKVQYIGISDTPAWVISRSQAIAELRGWTQLAAIQLNYNLTERTAERELLPMASDLGLSVAVWGALAGGVLSGKYRRGKPAGEGRLSDPTFRDRGLTERNHDIVDVLIDVAAELDATPAQAALSWLRAQSPLLIPIVGARTSEQLRGNLKGLSITLSDEHRRRLDDVSRPVLGFPHDFLASPAISSLVEGQFGQRLRARRRGSF